MGRAAPNFDCPRHQRFVEVKLRAAPAARFLNPSRTVAHNSEYRKQLSLPRPRFDATEIRERLGAGRKVVIVGAGFIGLEIAVPEPTTWALMTLGFVVVGGAAYASRRRQAVAAV
jgi:PEP-CTERM motif